MGKIIKGAAITGIIILALLGITGCGQNKSTETKVETKEKVHLTVAGSGTNIPGIRKLAEKFMEKNSDVTVEVPESIGSTGAVKSVNEKSVNIGLLSRELTTEEKGFGLEYIPYSRVLIVFAVNPSVKIDNLTGEQILNIYNGKITNWKELGGPDKAITVLNREKNDSSRLIWNKYIKGFQDMEAVKGAVLLKTDQAMNEALVSVEDSIGWTDMGGVLADSLKVNVIKLNGVEATKDMNKAGKYPYEKELAFVTKGKPDKYAARFIDFVLSKEGTKILEQNGYLPVGEK